MLGAPGGALPGAGVLGRRAGRLGDRSVAGGGGRGRRSFACTRRCSASVTTSREVPSDLSTTLAQVVGASSRTSSTAWMSWQRTKGVGGYRRVGTVSARSEPSPANVDGLIDAFRLGYRELREIWTWVLPPRTIVELRQAGRRSTRAVSLRRSTVGDDHLRLCGGLQPARAAARSSAAVADAAVRWLAGVVRHGRWTAQRTAHIEQRLDEVCRGFEAEKRYLISRWRWPERLR